MITFASPASVPLTERERSNRVKSEQRKRTALTAVRLTPDEKARFQALADRKGWSLPDLMRLAVEAALMEESHHV